MKLTKRADIVFDLISEIREAQKGTIKNFLIIGCNLDKIQSRELWKYYSSHLETFEDLLTELGFKHATAWNFIRIWREFGTYNRLYACDYTRLVKLLPIVKEDNKKEWLEKAENLTVQDFEDEIRIARGKISFLDCDHPIDEREFFFRCRKCSKFIRLEEQDYEKIEKKEFDKQT